MTEKNILEIFSVNTFKNVVLIFICIAKLLIRSCKKSNMLVRDSLIKKCINAVKLFDPKREELGAQVKNNLNLNRERK